MKNTIGCFRQKSDEFEESVDVFILVFALQISEELVGEQLLSEMICLVLRFIKNTKRIEVN